MYKWKHNLKKPFELNINYRSHDGILRLASSVIDLINHFFPDSIDQLSPEHGQVGGPRPLIFEGFQAKDLFTYRKDIEKKVDTFIKFGVSQVIIVRDDTARERLKSDVGFDVGLILTVFEVKGMEFNDVLLYNFFSDSPARKKV